MSQLIRRYRRVNQIKALKLFSPIFSVDVSDVMADLSGSRR